MADGSQYWGAQLTDPDENVRLWPGTAPGGEHLQLQLEIAERSTSPEFKDRAATGISEPLFTVFRPSRADGSAVLIFTGGNYQRMVIDKEGFESARRLNEAGITAFVMRYRLPCEGWSPDAPLQDAQRAIRIVRAHAGAFDIDPARVGVLGASAGGHVAASLATRHAEQTYEPVDEADAGSARPDFMGLLYPVVTMSGPDVSAGAREALLGKEPSQADMERYSRERSVDADTPPAFLLAAVNDGTIPFGNTVLMYNALRAANIPAELHLFESGGHGFGIRLAGQSPVSIWPELFLNWGKSRGYFRRHD
ncbi:MAG: alpha/beta hydrolase [Rhizomicrobium sp.]|jgi:acetyl esterase/lipase